MGIRVKESVLSRANRGGHGKTAQKACIYWFVLNGCNIHLAFRIRERDWLFLLEINIIFYMR